MSRIQRQKDCKDNVFLPEARLSGQAMQEAPGRFDSARRHECFIKKLKTMDRRIEVTGGTRAFIRRTFGVTDRTVLNALTHDVKRGDSDLAKRIRSLALQKGGRYVVTIPEDEAFWDSYGVMKRRFGNGAELVADRKTGTVELFNKGGELNDMWENPSLTELDAIIRRAEEL